MSKETDYNPVVWVSLASVSGLSLISLGQPGLRTDLDEQVYTGGLTAVQAMLGGEVGGDTDRFVGGSHSNRTGRFRMRNEAGGELVGQFLLISPKNIKVADDLVDYYEQLVTIFAEDTLQTEVYERVEREFRSLGVNDVIDIFFESINKARKKKSIQLDDKLFFTALNQATLKSINDYEYSSTLVKVSEYKEKYRDLSPKVSSEKEKFLLELSEDILELLTSDHPHALVLFPKIKSLRKDFFKYFKSEIKDLNAKEGLEEIINEFKKNELTTFLDDFALHEVNKANLYDRLEDEIFSRFKREFPLLFLVDPEITGFKESISNLTADINEQYDLAGTLSRIGLDLLKDKKTEQELFIPYIRHYCDQFSTGLTVSAWKYMQVLFRIISQETNIDVTDVIPSLKGQIPDSHFATVEKMITKYKLTRIDSLSFSVRQASDILPFYRGLFSTLAFGFNNLLKDLVLSENNPDNFLRFTVRNFKEFVNLIHPIYAFFSIYSFVENNHSRFDFTPAFPEVHDFGEEFNIAVLTPELIIEAFIKANINYTKKEQELVFRRLEEFHKSFENRISDILKFHSKNPLDISKGYSLKLNELKTLSFSTKLPQSIEEIIQKIADEYEKIINQSQSELDKIKDLAKQFLEGKISEKDFKKNVTDAKYLSKTKDDFEKSFKKMWESMTKKYSELPSEIEKRFRGLNKDFSKEFSQAGNFLNMDRKAILKDDRDVVPSSSSIREKIQSLIKQIIDKDPILTWDNFGYDYFYVKNRMLPLELQANITNGLVHKKTIKLMKEATESLKNNPTLDIYKCYSDVLDSYIKDVFIRLFGEIGSRIGKNFIRMDQEIYFIEKNKVPTPSMMVGILLSVNAMNSIRSVLGSRVAVETEENEGGSVFHISAVIPDFGCNLDKLKKVWKSKEWTLHRVLLLLSWYSLLEKNAFYLDMLRYSSGLYSTRVKDTFEAILNQIAKYIVFQ